MKKVIYSDLGIITLYKIIETITGQKFDEYVKKEIFEPLNMKETLFNPSFNRNRYAATEYSEKLGEYKHGIVHDDNTESMGGISGHAGLFSTVNDLAQFASMIENDGIYEGERILTKASIDFQEKTILPLIVSTAD